MPWAKRSVWKWAGRTEALRVEESQPCWAPAGGLLSRPKWVEVRKDRAAEQEQVHISGVGGGQEEREGNSTAFKKVVMEKELFDEGSLGEVERGFLLCTSRVSTNLGLGWLNSSRLF